MKYFPRLPQLLRLARPRWLVPGVLAVSACTWLLVGLHGAQAGLGGGAGAPADAATPAAPAVRVTRPQRRTIVRTIGQPSFVESYERTSIYPKVTGYIEKWTVDIGDRVKKGDVLATLYVPELREDWQTKKETVRLDQEQVELARKVVRVAGADVQAAQAHLAEARSLLDKYRSDVDRWGSEVKRLEREVGRGVVDPQVLLESRNQLRMSTASLESAKATVERAKAQLLAARETLGKDQVDVGVARARVRVAASDAKRLEDWVGYLTLRAPYDGVIVARNANTWDFVMPRSGDPSADRNAPHLSPDGSAAPVYVMDRTDVVRVFVDVPEADANYVRPGSKASVLVRAFRDEWIPATVTRTSWALNTKSRTLRAEIDLRNTDHPDAYRDPGSHPVAEVPADNGAQLLPGMYAYGKVVIERPNVWALPATALVHAGDETYYWGYEKGRAVKVDVQTDVSDGEWVEVISRRPARGAPGESGWVPVTGSERVLAGDLSGLSEGDPVRPAKQPAAAAPAKAVAVAAVGGKGHLPGQSAGRGKSDHGHAGLASGTHLLMVADSKRLEKPEALAGRFGLAS